MSKKTMRLWSLLLVFVMIFNMLPMNAMAVDTGQNDNSDTVPRTNNDAYIIEEVIANRTEYTKEFVMSNGLHMAAVYDNAVHYQENGQWKEIDNTLKLASTRSGNVYTNTAGGWQVSFPQSLTGNNGITISRDEYTLSFRMSGELHKASDGTVLMNTDENAESASESDIGILDTLGAEENLSLSQPAVSTDAIIHTDDQSDVYADAQYEETVVDTLHAKLEYADVYDNTDIIYELNSNLVKESVVINQFDATLYGYTYLLDVGEMIPVLKDNGEIELYDATHENVVMLMPAPYLVDNAGEYNYDVQIMLDEMDGTYVLSYLLPQDWIADENREWPVVLDPIVCATATTGNIRDMAVYSKTYLSHENPVLQCGNYSSWGVGRIYLKYNELPVLSSSDVIVAANVTLYASPTSIEAPRIVEVHKVSDTWASETITWDNKPDPVDTVEDYQICQTTETYYTWDITDIARGWYDGENTGMMFKVDDASEASTSNTRVQFYSSDYGVLYKPTVLIMFRNNNGLEGYWDYTSSSAGRAGTGYVNQYSGNLVWTHSDIGFGGNRMPVSISHVYNSNDSASNLFGMGNGWRTNFNQRVYKWTNSNAYGDYYVWEDADGTCHYFPYDSESAAYKDEDGMELTLTVSSSGYTITDKNGNTSEFDSNGRLCKQSNNQETKSAIEVTYTSSGFINTVKDGAGRVYTFHYSNSLLNKISYQGTDYVSFEYNEGNLRKIIDKDAAFCQYEYTDNNLLCTAIDVDGYKIVYTYAKEETGKPSRVATISEYSGDALGGVLSIVYGQNETTFTDHNGNTQTVQFNNWGNTISVQDDQGRAQYAQYAINEPVAPDDEAAAQTETETDNTAKGNQLRLASKMQNTVGNVLKDSSFENGTLWSATNVSYSSCVIDSANAYFGRKSLKVTHTDSSVQSGAGSASFTINPDETYTFSAYVKTGESSAYLSIGGASGYLYSETLPKNTDWTRLEVHYTNTTDAAQLVYAFVLSNGPGNTYLDCVQVEKAATASRYNLIENGDFRHTTHWSASGGRTTQEVSAAPELNTDVYKLIGDPTATNRISQTVQVSGAEGDVFVLGGWAMGESVPLDDTREFSLIATFNYTDNTTSKSTIRFNPCVDGWQYAAAPIVAEKAYSAILIEVAYDYNANIAYFDGIQLFKEAFGSSYTYDEDGNITAVKDIQGGETTYEYDESGNLSSVTLPDETVTTYEYDQYHNVIKATTSTGVIYDLDYDDYGNNISVTITNGGVSLTSAADYSDDGNILESTTDTAGNTTYYGYNATTNVLEWVKYPKDTGATKTTYSYDTMFRLVSSAVTTDQGNTLSASYTYENDLLKKLTTKSTEYTFDYGSFSRIKSIQAGQRTLASYTYTNDQNNYLDTLAYGNGDGVKYTYDTQGRVIAQTWETGDTVTYKYDNSGALASVTDSATGLTTTYYYDFTDRMMKYVEKGSGFSHSVGYEYDTLNNLTQLVNTINDSILTTAYTYDEDKRIETLLNTLCVDGTNLVNATTIYGYDAFGRLSGKATAVGENSIVSVAYTYRAGTGTTTGQVETLTISTNDTGYNDVYSYTYDGNGNIISVAKGEGDTATVTTYVYDTLNQLIRENNQAAGKTWVWTYDNAGNILAKTEYAYSDPQEMPTGDAITVVYTYGDNQGWGDLLTGYNNHTIRYDTIGNPVEVKNSDGDVVLEYTWEHGRQLAGLHGVDLNGGENDVTVSYTYNADGLRTNKTVTTITYHTHSYTSTVVAPTCTEGGYTAYTCTTCGNSYTDDETAVLGHSYQESVTGPTCTETGYTTYSCAACGDTYTSNETAALGHSYTETVVAPAEDEEGYTLYTCEVCGYSYKDSHLHSYTSTRVNPTCTEAGYTVHTCECGDSYQDSVTAALGHVYEDNGIFAVCKRCGKQSPIYTNPVQPSLPPVVDSETMSLSEEQDDGEALATIKEERTLESTIVTEYEYIYTGTQLTQMIVTTTVDGKTPTTQTLYFTYEASGLMTVTYNGTTYYYAANLQGDIVAILDASGAAVVEYTYDAWGKLLTTTGSLASTLGVTNPLTYRGYVYDTESTLYYLQSRYYDPELGRFINADAYASTGQGILGNNMFAYCNNNSVNSADPCGTCVHRLDFWNDCENCKEKSVWQKLWDVGDLINESQQKLVQEQQYQTQLQHELVDKVSDSLMEIRTHQIEMQSQATLHQIETVNKTAEFLCENPKICLDIACAGVATATYFVGLYASAGLITIVPAVATAIDVANGVCTAWTALRLFETVWEGIS